MSLAEPSAGRALAPAVPRLAPLLREVNRRLVARARLDVGVVACECESRGCAAAFEIPLAIFQVVDARPGFYVVCPGHEDAEADRVVRRERAFWVVQRKRPPQA